MTTSQKKWKEKKRLLASLLGGMGSSDLCPSRIARNSKQGALLLILT